MLDKLRKIFKTLDDASRKAERKCGVCGHVMQGYPRRCEKCGTDLEDSFE